MCVSQSVVVHLELEDSVNIGQLKLDTIFASYGKENIYWLVRHSTLKMKALQCIKTLVLHVIHNRVNLPFFLR